MSPLLIALLPYLLMTLTLAACLVVLLQSSTQTARLRRKLHESQGTLRAEHAALKQRVDQLASEVTARPEPVPARQPGPSLNLTRRGAALRLARSGENTEAIAATLQVPQNEVQLLMKVQHLLAQTSGVTPAPANVSREHEQGGSV